MIGVCQKYVTNLVVILVEAVKQDAATEQPGDGNFRKRLSGHGSVHIETGMGRGGHFDFFRLSCDDGSRKMTGLAGMIWAMTFPHLVIVNLFPISTC